jgi:SWI/SNF-related matrix-associated actin-dependent regulator 1 of chromatin subfamily A
MTFSAGRFVATPQGETDHAAIKAAGARFVWDRASRSYWTKFADQAVKLAAFADETAAAKLAGVPTVEQRATAVVASRAQDAAIEVPAPAGLNYLPFQRAGIAYSEQRAGVLMAPEQGLGKTIIVCGVINRDSSIRRALVLCPKTPRGNWRNELNKWLTRRMTIGIGDAKQLPLHADIVIIHYDVAHRYTEQLHSVAWDLIVCDEAHLLKNPKAQRTILVFGKKGKRAKGKAGAAGYVPAVPPIPSLEARRKMLLTGTPIVNRPMEVFPLLHYVDSISWPEFFPFAKRYCDANRTPYGWDFKGASHLDELQQKMRETVMYRVRKSEVLTELPRKFRQVIEIPANGAGKIVAAEREAYDLVNTDEHKARIAQLQAAVEAAKLTGNREEYAAAINALQQGVAAPLAEISAMRKALAIEKAPYVIEHVQTVLEDNPTHKVVVFAWHHEMVNALRAAFADKMVEITGRTTGDRTDIVRRFQEDPSVQVFVGSITAAGTAITLTAASHVIFAELDWVPGNLSQAEDRCHRIGQHDNVLVQHLVFEGSLDATMVHMIIAKQAVIDAAVDDVHVAPAPAPVAAARAIARPVVTEPEWNGVDAPW